MMRKPPETEVKITETITRQETLIVSDGRRDETRLPAVEPEPIPLASEREGGDDWFTWISVVREKPVVVREKPVVVPPGKKKQKTKNICFSSTEVENFKCCLTDTRHDNLLQPPNAAFLFVPEAAAAVAEYERLRAAERFRPAERGRVAPEETKPQQKVQQEPVQAVRKLDDDWFLLLDTAGRFRPTRSNRRTSPICFYTQITPCVCCALLVSSSVQIHGRSQAAVRQAHRGGEASAGTLAHH